MGRVPYSTLIWPGLPQLWRHGSWSGLGQAIGFALLLNATLLATYGWTEWISTSIRLIGWVAVAAWWLAAVIRTRQQQKLQATAGRETVDLYADAQREYLNGNWYQTELLLVQMLQQESRDVDARLMLATLLRHTGRRAEGVEQLRRLEKTEGHEKWRLEIQREWHRLTGPEENEQLEKKQDIKPDQGSNQEPNRQMDNELSEQPAANDPREDESRNGENNDDRSHAA